MIDSILCCRIGYHEELVGFITARVCLLHECNPTDRVLMNLNSAYLDGQRVLYILTLGVLESARQQGIGSALLRLILEEVTLHYIWQPSNARHTGSEVLCHYNTLQFWQLAVPRAVGNHVVI